MDPDDGGRRYPTWVRVTLVGLQAAGIVVGLVVGTATYDAWSEPDEPRWSPRPPCRGPSPSPRRRWADQATTPKATATVVSRATPTRSTDEVTTGIP